MNLTCVKVCASTFAAGPASRLCRPCLVASVISSGWGGGSHPPGVQLPWLSKPGWGPDPHSRVGTTGSSWCRALSFTTSPSNHQLPQWVVREPKASSGVRGRSKSQKKMEGAGEEHEEE